MALGSCYIFFFQNTSGQLNSTDFRRVMTWATQKKEATTTLKKTLLNISRTFYQCNLRLSFLDWEPKCLDNLHHTVLSSATGLESPKSLASVRVRQLAKRLSLVLCTSAWSSLCSSILVLFSIFKLVFSTLYVEVKRWRKLEIVAVSFSSSLSLLSLHAHKCIYEIIEHDEPKVFKLECR